MSTVKISELIQLPSISANTSNTIFLGVDLPTGVTGQFTATTLAQQLYSNNHLNVGNHAVIFPDVVAQFAGEAENYLQVNLQNDASNGSSDYIVTGDNGTDVTNYIDLGFAGSTYNYPGYTVYKPADGYLLVQGGTDSSTHGGNLVMGVVTQNRDIVFFQGGSTDANVVAKFSYGNGFKLTQKPIIFADGTTQNTAAATLNYSQASYAQANTNANDINYITSINTLQNTNITNVNTKAQASFDLANTNSNTITYITGVNTSQNTYASAAFAKANAALANTTGTFAGDLTIAGSLKTTGLISLNNSSFATDTSFLSLTASNNFVTVAPSNTNYMIHVTGKANSVTRVVLDSFGQNTYPVVVGRMGRGSAATPAATLAGDVLMRVVGNGYTGTQFAASSPSKIDFVAAENFSDTNRGTRIEFWNTQNGSTTIQKIASFNSDTVEFTGTVNPQKGFIYTPRVPDGNQTAITINYATDSIIKANSVADVTISHTNFTAGKVVEVWIVNNDNVNHTVTHGCAALRSTTKSTSFTLSSQSCAYMRFFSIDGDLANTFVTVTA